MRATFRTYRLEAGSSSVIIVAAVLALPEVRGWIGEKTTSVGMSLFLGEEIYRRIDNLIVPSRGGTTRIDHILVSTYGIFVIETKNMKGWIFGSAEDDRWTQVLFGRKHQFQNPLKQNYRHTRSLAEYLHLDHRVFHSVVWFIGDCTFKTEMPENVLDSGLSAYIEQFSERRLTEQQVAEIERTLRALKENPVATKSEHLRSLLDRHESRTGCPRCGAPLEQRIAKKGPRAGKPFLGCSRYPACEYLRNLD
jgi:restriction system protein